MPIDWKGVSEKVVVGVTSAAVLGALVLLWHWGSSGGLIRARGGVTLKEVDDQIAKQPRTVGSPISGKIEVATDGNKAKGDNASYKREQECPQNTALIRGDVTVQKTTMCRI